MSRPGGIRSELRKLRSDSLFQVKSALPVRDDRGRANAPPTGHGVVPVVKLQVTSVPKVELATFATPPDTAAL
jgi:hypothetical protein